MRFSTVALSLLLVAAPLAALAPAASAANYCTKLTDRACPETVCYGIYTDQHGRRHCRVGFSPDDVPVPCRDYPCRDLDGLLP